MLKKTTLTKFLPAVVIVLLCVLAIVFWKAHIPKPTAPVEEKLKPKIEEPETTKPKTAEPEIAPKEPETKEQEPPRPAKVVFRSALADYKWYEADPKVLRKQFEGFFQKAEVEPISNVIALILPHAGYRYSGRTAVYGLKTLGKKYKRIIVIGPSHNGYLAMEEVLSVPRVTHYETPLGQTPLDLEFINKLLKYPVFQNVPRAHKDKHNPQVYEHSVQIELPLLQYCQKDFKFVPIVAGRC